MSQILVQLAKKQGAEVFATVGSPEKVAIAKQRDGTIDVTIDRIFPLEEAREALSLMMGRPSKGKILYKVLGEG